MAAFSAAYDDDHAKAVFTTDGKSLKTIAEVAEPDSGFYLQQSINNAGEVTFRARLDGNSFEGIYKSDGGPLTTIATTADAQLGGLFSYVSSPVIDDSGLVAFTGRRRGAPGYGCYVGSGGPLTYITEVDLALSRVFPPSINRPEPWPSQQTFTKGQASSWAAAVR